MSDLFELQDNLVRRIVESLSVPLSTREHVRLSRDVPATSVGYECYLRGNELSRRGLAGFDQLNVARDLYLRSVETDPLYAPAWAQLGRCYRLIGKGMEHGRENLERAESAFQRALNLNPELPLAHSQYAFLEAELGRAKQAVTRPLGCALRVAALVPTSLSRWCCVVASAVCLSHRFVHMKTHADSIRKLRRVSAILIFS
jgi:adenylate cyclase